MNNKNHNYEKKKSNEKKGKRYKNKMQGMMVKGVQRDKGDESLENLIQLAYWRLVWRTVGQISIKILCMGPRASCMRYCLASFGQTANSEQLISRLIYNICSHSLSVFSTFSKACVCIYRHFIHGAPCDLSFHLSSNTNCDAYFELYKEYLLTKGNYCNNHMSIFF